MRVGEIEAAPIACDLETLGCADPLASPGISEGQFVVTGISVSPRSFPKTVSTLYSSEQGDTTHDKVARRLVGIQTFQGHYDS